MVKKATSRMTIATSPC